MSMFMKFVSIQFRQIVGLPLPPHRHVGDCDMLDGGDDDRPKGNGH